MHSVTSSFSASHMLCNTSVLFISYLSVHGELSSTTEGGLCKGWLFCAFNAPHSLILGYFIVVPKLCQLVSKNVLVGGDIWYMFEGIPQAKLCVISVIPEFCFNLLVWCLLNVVISTGYSMKINFVLHFYHEVVSTPWQIWIFGLSLHLITQKPFYMRPKSFYVLPLSMPQVYEMVFWIQVHGIKHSPGHYMYRYVSQMGW